MRVLAGRELGGASLAPSEEKPLGRGSVGHATFGPGQLLRDLELRLGLGAAPADQALRVSIWAARMAAAAPEQRFYARSFALDALGTAETLLHWRDTLVEAGWEGQAIAGGGPRLQALAELEALDPPLPAGFADRLVALAHSIAARPARCYAELTLLEPPALWGGRWLTIFAALERAGTRVGRWEPAAPAAPANSDLGRLQAALRRAGPSDAAPLDADGSVVVLRAETTWEAARATAALLARMPSDTLAVIRQHDADALDHALAAQGLATQGVRASSPWRSALQVLPLALELAFEPKDPYRVLELLTLPVGPFRGATGQRLARALAEAPGIGGPPWEAAKATIAERVDDAERRSKLLDSVAEWFERPGADPVGGISKPDLLALIERVRAWALSRIAVAADDALLAAAQGCATLRSAVEHDPRARFSQVETRRLAEQAVSAQSFPVLPERAGRIDHVSAPAALLVPRDTVVWWPFVDREPRSASSCWRQRELAALQRAGISFPDPAALLAERARGWRRAVGAARRRLILVIPRVSAGQTDAEHPLWDEIVTRARWSDREITKITLSPQDLLRAPDGPALFEPVPIEAAAPAALPGSEIEWRVAPDTITTPTQWSPRSLTALLGCPLSWALDYAAGLRPGGHALPPLVRLSGSLGHRLVELLHGEGAFALDDAALELRAEQLLELLFRREGALLLRAGMGFERSQLKRQLLSAVVDLSGALRASSLRVVAVEQRVELSWRGGKLVGAIDLLVASPAGVEAIIDMKWGISSYREQLRSGQALQLAAYAFAHSRAAGKATLAEASYFSLKQAKLLGLPSAVLPNREVIDGPSLQDCWGRVERSVDRAEATVTSGRLPVVGLAESPPLLDALGVPQGAFGGHFARNAEAACEYCRFDAVCGKRWEVLA